ncbi:hypothetical protein ACR79B_20500 [Sphingobacterium spiritivorum]|uniref:hypothetical protein n=1 Tax=Sphingobacterium spiritivorum TaxID=258 RepID=UPI003DA27781
MKNVIIISVVMLIIMITGCSKDKKEDIDYRENNPAFAKLTVQENVIDVFSPEKKQQSLILDEAYYFEKAKNVTLTFSSFKSEGVDCGSLSTAEIKLVIDGTNYSFRAKDKLVLKLDNNKYVLDRIIKCDK